MRMTSLLIESRRPFESSSLVLMPVMRAGLAMWVEANELFNAPQTVFVWARKDKRGRHVNLVSAPVEIPDGRDVLLFDPIIARGDTLRAICDVLERTGAPRPSRIHIFACYASPEGIAAICARETISTITVGVLGEGVDEEGYVIPPINGDAGDKLFGRMVGDVEQV